jgi:hypothetical protein
MMPVMDGHPIVAIGTAKRRRGATRSPAVDAGRVGCATRTRTESWSTWLTSRRSRTGSRRRSASRPPRICALTSLIATSPEPFPRRCRPSATGPSEITTEHKRYTPARPCQKANSSGPQPRCAYHEPRACRVTGPPTRRGGCGHARLRRNWPLQGQGRRFRARPFAWDRSCSWPSTI